MGQAPEKDAQNHHRTRRPSDFFAVACLHALLSAKNMPKERPPTTAGNSLPVYGERIAHHVNRLLFKD